MAPHHRHTHQRSHPSDSDIPKPPLLDTLPTSTHPLTNAELNLSVLRRHLPLTHSIRFVAQYAVIYVFSPTTSSWEKSGIEGTLFIVRLQPTRGDGERYAIAVLNRRGLDNFVVELSSREDVQREGEYIILQGTGGEGDEGEQRIYGVWVFQEEGGSTAGMRDRCSETIVECAALAEKGEQGQQYYESQSNGLEQPSAPTAGSPDLMALLNGSRPQQPTPTPLQNANEQRDLLDLFRSAGQNVQY